MASGATDRSKALVLVDVQPHEQARRTAPGSHAEATFEAQLLGQPGQKRGLRGGAPVLEAARGAYLTAEFAGGGDRRPSPGLLTVRKI